MIRTGGFCPVDAGQEHLPGTLPNPTAGITPTDV